MLAFVIIFMIVSVALVGGILVAATVIQNSRAPPDFSLSRSDESGGESGGDGGGGGEELPPIEITPADVQNFINAVKVIYYTGGGPGDGVAVYLAEVNKDAALGTPLTTYDVFISSPPGTLALEGAFGTAADAIGTYFSEQGYLALDTTGKLSIIFTSKTTGGYTDLNDFIAKEQDRQFVEVVTTTENANDTNLGQLLQIIAKQNPIVPADNFLIESGTTLVRRFNTADANPQPIGAIQAAKTSGTFQTPGNYYYKYEYQLTLDDVTSKTFAAARFSTYGLNSTEQEEHLKNLYIGNVDGAGRIIYHDTDPDPVDCITVSAGITNNDFLNPASTDTLKTSIIPLVSGTFDNASFAGYGTVSFVYYQAYDLIFGVSQNGVGCMIYTGTTPSDVTGGTNIRFSYNTVTTLDEPDQSSYVGVTFKVFPPNLSVSNDPADTSVTGFFAGNGDTVGALPSTFTSQISVQTIGATSITIPSGAPVYFMDRINGPGYGILVVKGTPAP